MQEIHPNPFEISERPRIQFAIPNGHTNNLPTFEVRIYDTRGFELLRKRFVHTQESFTFSRNTQEETYINLWFEQSELENKLSAGGYLYLLFMNDEIIHKGKMAVKALK